MKRRWALALLLVLSAVVPVAATATEDVQGECLRFGVYPGNTFTVGKYAGLPGAPGAPLYGHRALAAMEDLAGGRDFDIHFYASWRDGLRRDTIDAMRLVARRGLQVNLALKYLPPEGRDGDIVGFASWVAAIVRTHPEVTTVQVTNEANSGASTDSDGGSTDPLGALIEGVKSAAQVKKKHQQIGFNWFYRLDPVSDQQFWSTLGQRGGQAFRDAVDWAGVDIYAGTYVPPAFSVDDEADFRAALEYTRNEMMPLAGLGPDVPLYVQETGYPTLAVGRDGQRQADALAAYIRATAGLNVQLIQWFQLADAESTLGDGWGLVDSAYEPKPAYYVMRDAARRHVPC